MLGSVPCRSTCSPGVRWSPSYRRQRRSVATCPAEARSSSLPASLPVVTVEGPVYRCHSIDHGYLYFGTSAAYRFDDPLRMFGVMYLGQTREAAFAETCLRNVGSTLISESFLAVRAMIEVGLKPIMLLEAYGAGLAKIGQTALISASPQDHIPDDAGVRARGP